MIRVVLDTNIEVSALLKSGGHEDHVLRLGLAGRLELCASPAILDEYTLVLPRPKFKFTPQEITTALDKLRKTCLLVHPSQRLTVSSHEADNRFLECVQEAKAHFLVTGNKRHFPKEWKSTRVVNARELLAAIS